jgi:hypothetical protein
MLPENAAIPLLSPSIIRLACEADWIVEGGKMLLHAFINRARKIPASGISVAWRRAKALEP